MRLYKEISPILLLILIVGIIINSDGLIVPDFGGNEHIEAIRCDNDLLAIKIEDNLSTADVLKELDGDNYKLIDVARKEVGNVGGKKYWSWFGFDYCQGWCCCFVSWCADQCGLIENGVMPKFSSVASGEYLFKSRDRWLDWREEPGVGMVIFFDFINDDSEFIMDGKPDHVGLVKKVEDGIIYCIEGNYNNMVAETSYSVGCINIYGYGMPRYK